MAVSIDIERGVHHRSSKPAPPSVSRPGLPLLRRRKGLVIILCVSFLLLLGLNANRIPGAQSSITWVKDSMGRTDSAHLPTEPLPNDFSLNVASQAAAAEVSGGLARPGSGTDALKKLAEENGIDPAQLDKDVTAPGAKPTSSEWILLFLQALSNPAYQVPSWQTRWKKQLMPTSEKAFIGSLSEVTAGESAQDIALFKTDRARWNAAHQAQHPLTVFSKSYCPFSKRAKELLKSMGAKFNVIEVDLRPHDAQSLQAALAALSGHHTFPAIFTRDRLLGGSDDLQTLQSLKVLPGMLRAAGAL